MKKVIKLILLITTIFILSSCSENNHIEELNSSYLKYNIKTIIVNQYFNDNETLDYIQEPNEESSDRIILKNYSDENVNTIKKIIANAVTIKSICKTYCDDKKCVDCINPSNPDYLLEIYDENNKKIHEIEMWLYDLKEALINILAHENAITQSFRINLNDTITLNQLIK